MENLNFKLWAWKTLAGWPCRRIRNDTVVYIMGNVQSSVFEPRNPDWTALCCFDSDPLWCTFKTFKCSFCSLCCAEWWVLSRYSCLCHFQTTAALLCDWVQYYFPWLAQSYVSCLNCDWCKTTRWLLKTKDLDLNGWWRSIYGKGHVFYSNVNCQNKNK